MYEPGDEPAEETGLSRRKFIMSMAALAFTAPVVVTFALDSSHSSHPVDTKTAAGDPSSGNQYSGNQYSGNQYFANQGFNDEYGPQALMANQLEMQQMANQQEALYVQQQTENYQAFYANQQAGNQQYLQQNYAAQQNPYMGMGPG